MFLAMLVVVMVLLFFGSLVQAATKYEFGDAPDGGLTFYTGSGVAKVGAFPTKLSSNGARIADTDVVWMGEKVNKEADSNQADQFDDGVAVELKANKNSKAYIFVHVKEPGKISGTAYINLFFDWNKDGKWEDATTDPIPSEWAVRNFPVDLSLQTKAVKVYVPEFMAGSNVANIWYRALLTKDERFVYSASNTFGQGLYEQGEVEDYGPWVKSGKKYKIVCTPDLRVIRHGKTGFFRIRPKYLGAPNITNVLFANSVAPRNNDQRSNNSIRDVRIFGKNNKGAMISYRSKKIDPPARVVFEDFSVRARYGKEASVLATCHVAVVHYSKKVIRPMPQNVSDYTLTGATGSVDTVVSRNSGTTTVNGTVQIDTEMIQMNLQGFSIPLDKQNPSLPTPSSIDINVDGLGWPADWQCNIVGNSKVCFGNTSISHYFSFSLLFQQILPVLHSLHINFLDNLGNVVGAGDLPGTD